MQLVGKIKRIEAVKQISETFKSQEVIIITEEQYPQIIPVQFTQSNVEKLNSFKIDDKVSIDFSFRGKEVEKDDKKLVFLSLNGWKITKVF